jgi:hypothetical protein
MNCILVVVKLERAIPATTGIQFRGELPTP